jgi:hypothetical protein
VWKIKKIPVGARFFAPFHTGPGAHPGSCTMGTGSFQGVQRPGLGVDHPPHLAPMLKKEQSYTSILLWAFMAGYKVKLVLYIYHN